MRRLAAALLLAVSACGSDPPPAPMELEVMSFNIRWEVPDRDAGNGWPYRKALVVQVLIDPTLDVVGLQEATPQQLADILEALPQWAAHDTDPVMNGIAILYRPDRFHLDDVGAFWFSPTPDVPESRDWHSDTRRHVCAWVRLVGKETARAFYVYDVHLDLDPRSRRLSAVLLGERIAAREHPDPVILLGDLNAPPPEAASRYLRGEMALPDAASPRIAEPLVDSFAHLFPDATETGTGNAFRGRTSGPRIDYVYVTPDVEVLDASIDRVNRNGRYPSDHFPVRARLRLGAP